MFLVVFYVKVLSCRTGAKVHFFIKH